MAKKSQTKLTRWTNQRDPLVPKNGFKNRTSVSTTRMPSVTKNLDTMTVMALLLFIVVLGASTTARASRSTTTQLVLTRRIPFVTPAPGMANRETGERVGHKNSDNNDRENIINNVTVGSDNSTDKVVNDDNTLTSDNNQT